MRVGETEIEVVRGSVLDAGATAIGNAANEAMRGGGGVDGAIHAAAGPQLLQELRRVAPRGANTGEAVLTRGHNLNQPFIIHTPGPIYNAAHAQECEKLLRSCYRSCLEIAARERMESVAFPSISTGIYGYPMEDAARAALDETIAFLRDTENLPLRRVLFSMRGEHEWSVFANALQRLRQHNEL